MKKASESKRIEASVCKARVPHSFAANFSAAYFARTPNEHTVNVAPVAMFHEPRKICAALDKGNIEHIHDPVFLPFCSFFIGPRCGSMQQRNQEEKKRWRTDRTRLAFWPFDGHPEIEFPLGR